MSPLSAQDQFAHAALDPSAGAPDGLAAWNGSSVEQRFGVYRNNVVVSLVDALAAKFPVVQDLVGEAFFRDMARVYVMQQPPCSPRLADYGAGFAEFIEDFTPAAGVPCLPDVARLEALRLRAYHAADATPLDAHDFANVGAERLFDSRVALHASAGILTSRYAVVSVWAAHQGLGDLARVDQFAPEDALVARPDLDVVTTRLAAGCAVFLRALQDGATIGEAAARASTGEPAFDPAAAFGLLLSARIAIALHC